MNRRVDGANRAVLILIALLLLAAGATGLATGFGVLGEQRAGSALLPAWAGTYVSDNPWVWWLAALACVLVALLGLRWLLAQFRVDRLHRLDLTTDDSDGLTVLHAGAVTEAVADDARGIRGVTDADAHLSGEPTERLVLTVGLSEYADIAAVRTQLQDRTVRHLRQALDAPDFPVHIQLRPGRRAGRGPG